MSVGTDVADACAIPGGGHLRLEVREEARVRLRRRQQRVLLRIEHDLAASEPGLAAFFRSFNSRSGGTEMPRMERVARWPFRMLDRLWPGRNATERATDRCSENRDDP